MRHHTLTAILVVSLLLFSAPFIEAAVKRGRNEGTMNITASNVVGNGNITVTAGSYGQYLRLGSHLDSSGIRFDPTVGLAIGISSILEFRAQTAFTNFADLGTSEVHLQFTTPGNDRLRFLGLAVCGDLYLSTSPDTISSSAVAEKPEYNSFMAPSATLDFDWLALFKSFPLKNYFHASFAGEPMLLHRYEQISCISGWEWKQHANSWFVDIGAALYKEKPNGPFRGDKAYAQRVVWFEPGARYRLFGNFCLMGGLRMAVWHKLKEDRPLPVVTALRGGVHLVVPIFYKETNTEAIRSLVFLEREKVEKKNEITSNFEQGKRVESGLGKEFKSLQLKSGIPDSEQEKEDMKKRKEIQQKMDEIERLLEEIQ
ncbi:MAG: hypothetical protein JXA71_00330 [Chitinispirillaceae bacterium]|nr:hypothetical protein [Chitinispirillaceae bacterium]